LIVHAEMIDQGRRRPEVNQRSQQLLV